MTNASKMFFRLHCTDLDDGGDPASADFDGDGLTTAEEIMTSPETNPLNADTDGGLLLDGFEVNYGSNTLRKRFFRMAKKWSSLWTT